MLYWTPISMSQGFRSSTFKTGVRTHGTQAHFSTLIYNLLILLPYPKWLFLHMSTLWKPPTNKNTHSSKPGKNKDSLYMVQPYTNSMTSHSPGLGMQFEWQSSCPACTKPWVWSPVPHKLIMMAHVWNPTLEM